MAARSDMKTSAARVNRPTGHGWNER